MEHPRQIVMVIGSVTTPIASPVTCTGLISIDLFKMLSLFVSTSRRAGRPGGAKPRPGPVPWCRTEGLRSPRFERESRSNCTAIFNSKCSSLSRRRCVSPSPLDAAIDEFSRTDSSYTTDTAPLASLGSLYVSSGERTRRIRVYAATPRRSRRWGVYYVSSGEHYDVYASTQHRAARVAGVVRKQRGTCVCSDFRAARVAGVVRKQRGTYTTYTRLRSDTAPLASLGSLYVSSGERTRRIRVYAATPRRSRRWGVSGNVHDVYASTQRHRAARVAGSLYVSSGERTRRIRVYAATPRRSRRWGVVRKRRGTYTTYARLRSDTAPLASLGFVRKQRGTYTTYTRLRSDTAPLASLGFVRKQRGTYDVYASTQRHRAARVAGEFVRKQRGTYTTYTRLRSDAARTWAPILLCLSIQRQTR
ncbi:hypothetical protein EVAR_35197_1 [Eumeta japonica]|uniref:Uncharacterized protein n=1 Tax=Eumeta variegata TaxID=151549 RepID=A0A4C1VF89_EUMVA|nr:hypothetical protein EVAR_35197_1 [Eumeta japonica]